MINVSFTEKSGALTGFTVSGHGTVDEKDFSGRLVCAAASSAVYLTVNTLTEIVGATVDYSDNGNRLSANVVTKLNESQVTLNGFKLHLTELSKQYPKNITIISEV